MQTNYFSKTIMVMVSLLVLLAQTQAQQKKRPRKAVKKSTTINAATTKNAPASVRNYDSIPVKRPVVSLEADFITQDGPVKQSTVLAYEPISEDDVAYRQRVWRDIDVREKINLPFAYTAEENKGSQQLIYILLNAIRNDPAVVAYSSLDDRFTIPLKKTELARLLVGDGHWDRVPNWQADNTGSQFIDTFIVDDFNPARITRYRLKEDWVFNKKTSRLVVRILGIAPIVEDSLAPGLKIEKPLFWLYYPKLRNTLADYEAYNGKNHGARPTWEEVFESRMFNSYIVKSTMDNPGDLYLKDMPALKDNSLLQIWEGENIKNRILNYEQGLWSY